MEVPINGLSMYDILKNIQIKNPNKIFIIKDDKIFNYNFNFQVSNLSFTRNGDFYTTKKNGHSYCIYGTENIKKIVSAQRAQQLDKINISFLGNTYEFHRSEHNIKCVSHEVNIRGV